MIALMGFMFNRMVVGVLSHEAVEKSPWASVCALPYLEQMLSYLFNKLY